MKGGLGPQTRKKEKAAAAAEAAKATKEARKTASTRNYNSNISYSHNTGISKLNFEIINDASKQSLIDAVVNLINEKSEANNNNLKKVILNIMNEINTKYKSNFTMHNMYEFIFSNGGTFSDTDFTTLVHNIYPSLETNIVEDDEEKIFPALHPELKDEVAHRTNIGPTLGPKPQLTRQTLIEPTQGGKKRTKRRRQRRNQRRTNKRKKTKTRMKRRKTSKRKTNKRRRKR